jgi:hypothetical protein
MAKMTLPIANGFYQTDSTPISAQNCVNMYPVTEGVESLAADTLRSIPGCLYVDDTEGTTSADTCVNAHVFNGRPYFVIGAALWRLNSVGVLSNVGTLVNDGRPTIADNGTQMLICFPGSNGYIFTESTDTLAIITDADYTTTNGAPQAVVFIDSYFVCTTDEKKFIVSSVNDGTAWNALDFGTAESSPDDTITPVVYRNQLFIGGGTTLEAFSNLGGTDFPFERTGLFLDKGIYSTQTVVNAPDTFIFIGSGKNEVPAVWQFESNSVKKISNRGIDKLLREATKVELDASYGWSYGQSGNYFVGFVLAGTCVVYDLTTGKWHERLSDYLPADEQYLCSALDTYIKAIPDIFGYGIFSNNKTSGESASYDESGQSTPIYFETDVTTSVIYDINDGAPSSCQGGILYQHVHAGSYSPNFGIPAHDSNQPAGWVSGGAIIKSTGLNGLAEQPLIAITKFRDGNNHCAIWVDASHNLSVGQMQGTKFTFPSLSAIVVNVFYFLHIKYNTGTGAFIARIDGNEISGTIPSDEITLGAWSLGAEFYMNAIGDTGTGRYLATTLGYAVNGEDNGETAYAAYERTVKVPLTPGLVSGFSATVLSYAPTYYWKMDEASGAIVDTAGTRNASAVGTPTYDSGDIMNEAGAISLNGDSNFNGSTGYQFSSLNMTMGWWVEVGSGTSNETILQSGNAYNDRAWRAVFNNSTGKIAIQNQVSGTYSLSDAAVFDGTLATKVFMTIKHVNGDAPQFFVNGVSVGVGDAAITRTFPIGDANFYIGALGDTGYSDRVSGAISKLFIINQLVPDDRILHMYNEGKL